MNADIERLAQQLAAARTRASVLERTAVEGLDLEQAYAVQQRVVQLGDAVVRRQIGWKVGLTSPVAMKAFAADEPMAGRLFDDGLLDSGATLDPTDTCAPRIEGEILLEIGSVPPSDADRDVLLDSLVSVRVAIEVADSRIRDWPPSVAPAIADNACCGWLVVGLPMSPRIIDLAAAQMTLTADGDVIAEGRGVDCMGHPLESYRWFLGQAAAQGWTIEPGSLLLTGALGPPKPMEPGISYTVDMGALGALSLRYAGPRA